MIITRTPFRISLCGGGSDIKSFYEKHGGCVLSTTINKYMYITTHPSFDKKTTVLKYSKTETVNEINEIQHDIFRECLKKEKLEGLEITSIADFPQGTGLRSSSSFTVGLLKNLKCHKREYISKEDVPAYACDMENNIVHTTNGKQDQYAAFIDCLCDLLNKEEKDKYDNFLDMLYGKFGKSITEKFLKPYNEKLYAVDLKELDVDAMGRFFPYANIKDIINNMKEHKVNSYNNTFLYPKNGAGSFINILYEELDKNKVLLNTSITKIDEDQKIAYLSNGNKVEYEYIINTILLNKFLLLFNNYNELQKKLSYNKVLVFNLGFNKKSEKFTKEHWLYIPDKNINFYRCDFYNNILGQEKLSMYIEIGYNKNDNITKEEIDKQLELTLDNLLKLNIIDENTKLEEYVSIIIDPAYVHINIETTKEIDELKEKLLNNNIYTIGRYGAWIYNSMEDSMLKAKELAEKLQER